ncbi:MAG: M3 family metallopeptidase, partial [Coxiellaceae bacterium]|nr:M3 family metallopeptidase [Coxiellaceae bacterium]
SFLDQLVDASLAKAKEEFQTLKTFAKDTMNIDDLQAWDLAYASEKLRQTQYNISQEDLRPYFPEYKVLDGLFRVANALFNISIKPVTDADLWHPDAKCFAIYNAKNELISYFYIDLYARENKRGGAWMDDCRVRRRLNKDSHQTPVAFIVCNFNAPINDDPALFTHEDVLTLFHEFGHSLQHMLTKIDYADVSGINGVPWDAVEVASQFMENFVWEKDSLRLISEHYQTKQPLPDDLFNRMHKAKNFHSAMQMMRQLEFSLFDFHLHMKFNPEKENQVQAILDKVREQVRVIPTPEYNRFQHSFSHIFAGGYAAGYYSYKWAEVMAHDAFSLFRENGIFDKVTSQKFQSTFLEMGGAKEPLDLFIEFRGREPEVKALLIDSGIQ